MNPADTRFMRCAISLSGLSAGLTRPNPPVGAVIVKNGCIIGEGRHHCAGKEHAEVNAFNACRESPRGATLYVTLEPCSTAGRQPPCTERILREGVRRVVVACMDVNPRHRGRGLTLLQDHGIEVESGVCEEEAISLLEPFNKHITTGLPFVTLKLGMTLDGRIADRRNKSQWITGTPAREAVQEMRRHADAMLVGAGTVTADNPSLLYHGKIEGEPNAGNKLLRVVVDTRGGLSPTLGVFTDFASNRTILACFDDTPCPVFEKSSVRVWRFSRMENGAFPLPHLLKRLGEEGCMQVLCEGGGHLAAQLHEQKLIDEYALFYAPLILGDPNAVSGFAGHETLLSDCMRMRLTECRQVGNDCFLRIRPETVCG